MDKSIKEIKDKIIDNFPELVKDSNFKITSKETSKYNCIAWAYLLEDKWMWPNTGDYTFLDGIHYWPSDEIIDCDVKNFIKAFELKGYEYCENGNHEEGYRKIALYVKPNTTECTHAARELKNGFWTSKLGRLEDIQHGTPYTLEGKVYGKVYCFMKKKI